MWARFTVLNETPIASAIAGWVIPLSRSNTIWMRSRCAAGIFQRSAVFSFRICFLVHLTICPPDSDSQSESYRAPPREPEKEPKPLDSISYGSGMKGLCRLDSAIEQPSWLDGRSMTGTVVISCKNGLLDIRTRTLSPHTAAFFNCGA